MKWKAGLLAVAVTILGVTLSGCGGGGGGRTETPGIALTIGADTIGDGTRSITSRATVIAAALDAGAVVIARDYRTGDEVARGTLDAGGHCTLQVTPGLTVVVVITGTRGGKAYRLSTIIADVPVADEEVVADPATTIAAEAVASKHPVGTGTVLDDATFDAVLTQATAYLVAHPDDDYSITGGLIGGTAFGGVGSIVVATVQAVVDAVPDVIDNNLVLAKNAVQQIKEAGVPLAAMVNQEIPDAESIFTDEVIAKYDAFAAGLDESVMGTLLMGDWGSVQLGGQGTDANDVPLGRTYSGVLSGGVLTLTDTGAGTAGRYTIVTVVGALTRTVVAVKSGIQWTITETVSDGSAEYSADFPDTGHDAGANPSFTAHISLKNAAFPTALTFNGTASAIGAGKDAYTKMVFDGTLAAPDFSARGRFEVNFPTSKPAGAAAWQTVYHFPTSCSMTNADITITNGGDTTISLSGSISATLQVVNFPAPDGPEALPTHFAMTGTYNNSHSGLHFEGSITADWTNPGIVDELTAIGTVNMHGELTRTGHPTYYQDVTVTLNTGAITSQIDLRVGANRLQGSASGTMVLHNPPYGSLTLTNQAGVQFNLESSASYVLSGSVKAGSPLTQVAAITKVGDRVRITFTDSTFEEF